ncbi:MAG: ABC transporter ATP-binding protein/permease [Faecalicatena sp.]|uniref:ABC transporter ATP-binding protein/permease n=1 Tax=Faecalicatena sp. TaxID=2005360 RepID=UPI00258ECE64|nr:ABC transporter ATP-binding protein/permease [Faecalicatena sp.]MCI6466185.1 ABC transporter ATP-binding protein/permease [Faecalicatena sp.]MDY5619351.1 ABC transporter ATP-binding protein/permease [Lachnospiraceae bacterium]
MFHKRLLKEFKDNRKYTVGMVLTQWVTLLSNVALMLTAASLIGKMSTRSLSASDFQNILLTLTGVLLVRGGMNTLNSKFSFLASTAVKRGLRDKIYRKLMEMGSHYRETTATSEAVQISTEGVDQLEIYFGKYIPQFFYSLLAPATLFFIVGSMNMKAAAVLLLCVPLIPLSIVAVQKFAKKMLQKYWGTYTELGDSFLENLQGLTTLKIYQADKRYAEKMDEEAEKFRKITMRVLIMQLNSISVMDLVAYGGAAAGIIIGVLEFSKGSISLAECFFILMISAEFFLPLRLLGSFFHIAMNGNAAADKIFRLLDAPVPKKGSVEEIEGSSMQFENVTFGYDDGKPVLKNVSFQVEEGSFTALVGASGCGKSTIASLLMRYYLNYEGEVKIGGIPVRELNEEALYRKVTRIRHDSYIFKGTVRENLRMGKEDASKEEMLWALRKVNLYDTIMEKGGLDMQLSEQASNLSGGQKQRLALARALLHDSDIYLFDEATSNIDAESENQIMDVIRELAMVKSVILISHRLANVTDADQILMIQDGTVIERGKHRELLAGNGAYAKLYMSQKELEKYAGEGAA